MKCNFCSTCLFSLFLFAGTSAFGGITEVPLAESPHPKVCGIIGASFDDGDSLAYKAAPDFLPYYAELDLEITKRITWEPRLSTPLAGLGMVDRRGWHLPNDRIRYVSSAWGGAQTYHYFGENGGQLGTLDRRVYMKGLDCLLIGMSGSFFWHPESSINDLLNIYYWAQGALPDMKIIFIEYPVIMRGINVTREFYDNGIDWEKYHNVSLSNFRNTLCTLPNVSCVDAWEGFQGGRDGWHPNWRSVLQAAEKVDRTIREALGMAVIEYPNAGLITE